MVMPEKSKFLPLANVVDPSAKMASIISSLKVSDPET
jgi:hypothetical protein